MKKWMFRVACLLAFAFSVPGVFVAPPAVSATATTKYTLTTSAWTDLGAGPLLISAAGRAVYAVGDTTPAIVAEGFSIPTGDARTVNTASHVWAMSLDGISPFVYVSPILASGGSGGSGGAITAGTTATSGFSAGQLILSDGSVVKASNFGVNSGGGGTVFPMALAGTYNGAVFLYNGAAAMSLSSYNGIMVSLPQYAGLAWWDSGDYDQGPANHLQLGLFAAQPGIYGILEQRPLASQFATQAYHIYNTWTDDNNGEWGTLDWKTTANVLTVGTQKNGTGTLRPMNLVASGLQMNGTAGVTCSGAPTASFATVNGIVTHC